MSYTKQWYKGIEHSKWICKILHSKFIEITGYYSNRNGCFQECFCKNCGNQWHEKDRR